MIKRIIKGCIVAIPLMGSALASCTNIGGFSAGVYVGGHSNKYKATKKAQKYNILYDIESTGGAISDQLKAAIAKIQGLTLPFSDFGTKVASAITGSAGAAMVEDSKESDLDAALAVYMKPITEALVSLGFTPTEIKQFKFKTISNSGKTVIIETPYTIGTTAIAFSNVAADGKIQFIQADDAKSPATSGAAADDHRAILRGIFGVAPPGSAFDDKDVIAASVKAKICAFLAKSDKFGGGTAAGTSEKDYSVEYTAPEATFTSSKMNPHFGASIGYAAVMDGGLYLGCSLRFEIATGESKVREVSAAKSKTFQALGGSIGYEEEHSDPTAAITAKEKFSGVLSLEPGFAPSGNWVAYIPIEVGFSKTEYKFVKADASSFKDKVGSKYEKFAKEAGKDGVNSKWTVKSASKDGTTATGTPGKDLTFKKSKTSFVLGFGLGAKVLVADNFILDLRATWYPRTKVKISTPAIESAAVFDLERLGQDWEFKKDKFKVSVGFLFKVN
ncbi:MAG: hypothetical protein LBJ92_01420 [Holosporales bacterium]|jgi:opacity protein-like surface antigen|nr:hypothetical protein [Holosporales bacterium]